MGRLWRDNTKTSLAANRTREIRPSGMRGGLAETGAMGELGTHLAIERASVGNSPPKVIRAALLPDAAPVPACGPQSVSGAVPRAVGRPHDAASGRGSRTRVPEGLALRARWCR